MTERVGSSQAELHIALNAQLLTLSRGYRSAGIHRYCAGLLRGLAAQACRQRYTVFLGDPNFRVSSHRSLVLEVTRWPTAQPWVRILWEQTLLPVRLQAIGADLLHGLAYALPWYCPAPGVITIHDLSFMHYPQLFKPLQRLYLATQVRRSVHAARRVIAGSESTRRDVLRYFNLPADKVVTVHYGLEGDFSKPAAAALTQWRHRRDVPPRFILFVGTLEPRKNLATLVEAYARVRRRWNRAYGALPHLILVGGRGWHYDHIFARVEELDLREYVHFPGFVPDAELPFWYTAADVFVYPSLYEGFGFPVLEAMACGTPVIASRASSLPEVVGRAGILVAPQDHEALADTLWLLLTQDDARRHLSELGPRHAGAFTWSRCAAATTQVYAQALDTGGPI